MSNMLLALLALSLMASPLLAENLLYNGNFETGDLTSWTEAGPNIPQWHGASPVPAQIFHTKSPMFISEIFHQDRGRRIIRRHGMAEQPVARYNWSLGWTRSGSRLMGFPWVSQRIHVSPGKYLVSVKWDVVAGSTVENQGPQTVGGILMVLADDKLNACTTDDLGIRRTTWNNESNGKWVTRSFEAVPLQTRTGYIEVRLQMWDHNDQDIKLPDYQFVAFDNVELHLTPVGPAEGDVKQ